MGDNGSSAEDPSGVGMISEIVTLGNGFPDRPEFMVRNIDQFGGPWFENHCSHGWAHAMNTPFQWDKKIASHLGGSRTGMALMWPGHVVNPGGIRSQFTHIIDIVPTILEAAKLPAPETINGFKQVPMNGTSLLYTLNAPQAPERHNTQYFEVIANQGIYHDGWLASTTPQRLPWQGRGPSTPDPFNDHKWELYNLTEDFTQSHVNETLDIGEDTGLPVVRDYDIPFKFTGDIQKVTIDLKEAPSAPSAWSAKPQAELDQRSPDAPRFSRRIHIGNPDDLLGTWPHSSARQLPKSTRFTSTHVDQRRERSEAVRFSFHGVGSQGRVPLQVIADAVCRVRIPPSPLSFCRRSR